MYPLDIYVNAEFNSVVKGYCMVANLGRCFMGLALSAATASHATDGAEDRRILADMDIAYQAAVKANDAVTMDHILHDDFVLVLGDGTVHTKADLLHSTRTRHVSFEQQDEDAGTQVVRLFGDTAMVSARLWLKGQVDGQAFDFRVWFTDTYIRTPHGWRYAFAQAGARMPTASIAEWAQ
jgi:ketosteroid isomerase-like protein